MAYGPDGGWWVEGDPEGFLSRFEGDGLTARWRVRAHRAAIGAVSVLADGRLVSGGADGLIAVHRATGERVRSFASGSSEVVGLTVLDGETLVSIGRPSRAIPSRGGNLAKLWTVSTGKPAGSLALPAAATSLASAGSTLLIGTVEGEILRWSNATTGSDPEFLGAPLRAWTSSAFGADGTLAAFGASDGTIVLWDMVADALRGSIRAHRGGVTCLAFGQGTDGLVSGSSDGEAALWDVSTGRRKALFRQPLARDMPLPPVGMFGGIEPLALQSQRLLAELHRSPAYQLMMRGIESLAIEPGADTVWVSTKEGLFRWEPHRGRDTRIPSVSELKFLQSTSSGLLGVGRPAEGEPTDTALMVIDRRTGESRALERVRLISTAAISGDGRRALTAALGAHVHELSSGTSTIVMNVCDGLAAQPALAISTDGRWAACATSPSPYGQVSRALILISDLSTHQQVGKITAHVDGVTSLAFSPDGHQLVSTGADGTIGIWSVSTGTGHRIVVSGGEWVIYSDDGYFDASAGGGDLVAVRQADRAYPIDQFAMTANRPDILLERAGVIGPYLKYFERMRLRRVSRTVPGDSSLLPPRIELTAVKRDVDSATVRARCAAGSAPLDAYRVWVDGVPESSSPASGELSASVPLTSRRHRIEVSCQDRYGAESARALAVVESTQELRPDVYFLGIGVSTYQDSSYADLRFADDDARALAGLFSSMAGRGFGRAHVRTLVDVEATPGGIGAARSFLAQARRQDVVIVAFAGHGEYGDDEQYYFVGPTGKHTDLATTATSFDQMIGLFADLPARRRLLLVDTCASGELEPVEVGRGELSSVAVASAPSARGGLSPSAPRSDIQRGRTRFIELDLSRRTGAVVFSASEARQVSREEPELGHGVFTAAILEAFRTSAADRDDDGFLGMTELAAFVRARVQERTRGEQNPVIDRDNRALDLRFPLIVRKRR